MAKSLEIQRNAVVLGEKYCMDKFHKSHSIDVSAAANPINRKP
jgi:hypothetical protein